MERTGSLQLSVIIPTRDRLEDLRQCLEALSVAAELCTEVIVVDDGSNSQVDTSSYAFPESLQLISLQASLGSAFARNVGASAAKGDVLLFIDDDVCVRPESLASVLRAFEDDQGLGALIGRYDDEPRSPEFFSQFRNLLHAFTHSRSAGRAVTFWTGFGAVRSSTFLEHGGFREEAVIDDVEFGSRIAKAGVRVELSDSLQVKHLKRWTLQSMLRTDLLLRGVPWTLLLWQEQEIPNTLNLRHRSRCSVALAGLCIPLLVELLLRSRVALLLPPVLCAMVLINLDLFRFLQERKGAWFAMRSVPAHWFYLWTAAVAFLAGTAIFFGDQLRVAVQAQARGWRSAFRQDLD